MTRTRSSLRRRRNNWEALIKRARRDGAMRWSGLSGYVRRKAYS